MIQVLKYVFSNHENYVSLKLILDLLAASILQPVVDSNCKFTDF